MPLSAVDESRVVQIPLHGSFIARRHKAMLEGQMAEVLAKANVAAPRERAREIWLLSEGAISLMLVHGDRRYAAAGRGGEEAHPNRSIGHETNSSCS